MDQFSQLLSDEKYSDLTITCGDREFKAHRAVVCSQCPFFDRVCSQQAYPWVIALPEDDPEIFKLFLQFLYTGNYRVNGSPALGEPSVYAALPSAPGQVVTTESSDPSQAVDQDMHPLIQEWPEEDDDEDEDYTSDNAEEDELDLTDLDLEYDPLEDGETAKELREDGKRQITPLSELPDLGPSVLSTSVKLYLMADRYGVGSLKLLARDRLFRNLEFFWKSSPDFPDVVDLIYSSPLTGDTEPLRETICRVVATDYEDKDVQKWLADVGQKHGDFVAGVRKYVDA